MTAAAATDKKNDNQGVLWLSGRIQESKQVGTDKENFPIIETFLVTPAPDTYSHPRKFCIMSKSMLGKSNDELSIEVQISPRSYKDKNGKVRVSHELWAVR